MQTRIWIAMCAAVLAAVALTAAGGRKAHTQQANVAAPVAALGLALDGFHIHDGHPDQQMEALHYCSEVESGLSQCVLFDGAGAKARMIGVEYVTNEERVRALPEAERALWHSHGYEVTSGMLYAPGMPEEKQQELMKTLANTYGKTWHTWQTDLGHDLPLGRPDLMMAFTRDGQAKKGLTARRDRELGISTDELRSRRARIRPKEPIAGVDRGEGGESCPDREEIRKVKGRE